MNNPRDELDPQAQRTLRRLRICWAALLGGQAIFVGVLAGLLASGRAGGLPELFPRMFYLSAGWLIVTGPMGYFVRNQLYKAHWREYAVTPRGYMKGNLVLLALLAGASCLVLLTVLATEQWWPTAAVAAGSLLLQAVNFPTGKPMTPTRPTFVTASGAKR